MFNWKTIACAALAALLTASAAAPAEQTQGSAARVEQQLFVLGYQSDTFDGAEDDETRGALRSFQTANGLPVTGEIDEKTVEVLDSGTAVSCQSYLVSLSNAYSELPITQLGSANDTVGMVQRALRSLGYFEGASDGVFGEETRAAVVRFQLANGLQQTGVVDRSTLIRMIEGAPIAWQNFLATCACAPGDSGAYVRLVQQTLANLGYFYGGITGTYGEMTTQAVVDFQATMSLPATGAADSATCNELFMQGAAFPEAGQSDPAESGAVADLQRMLAQYGYYAHSFTGRFDDVTQTALMLFQIANGYPATGSADSATLALLEGGTALPLATAQARLLEQTRLVTETSWNAMTAAAQQMRGQAFEADDAVQYPGFCFVQYVCLSAGIPVATPQDLYTLIDTPLGSVEEAVAGDILAIDPGEEQPILLGVSAGDCRVIYATGASPWCLETDLRLMEPVSVERWRIGS